MSNLLHVTRLPARGKNPLLMEIQVSPDTAPYLVTSSKAVTWIPAPMEATPELWANALPDHVVRVAVRTDLIRIYDSFFVEILDAVREKGVEAEWGNVHKLTEDGVRAAVDHVSFYGMGETCLLIPSKTEDGAPPLRDIAMDLGCLPQPCKWLPTDCAVAVPKNREFVGMLGFLGRTGSVALVHNAARAVGIAWGT